MSWATLKIVYDPPVTTDLVKKIEVSLLRAEDGYGLRDWRPAIAQYKGGGVWQSSPLVDGRHLVSAQWDNAVETFDLVASSIVDGDELILFTQDLKRLMEKAVEYWKTDRQTVPVYLEAQAACETNARYAIIKSWSTPSEGNPYAQPFRNQDGSAMTNITLNIERGHWQETPPGTGACVQISGLSVGNEAQTFVPTASTDDAYIEDPAFISTGSTILYFGRDGAGDNLHSGVRFRNVTIANATQIQTAFVRFVAANSNPGVPPDCNITIIGEQNAAPAAFSTYANFVGRTRTTASVAWNDVPGWTIGGEYTTIDITSIVQEIIDLGGWASGNDLVIFFEENGSDVAGFRQGAAFDHATYSEPELVVVSQVDQVGRAATCDREVFVANKHNRAQLTHIFVDDGGVPGANQAGVSAFSLLPAVAANGDAIYFGSDTTTTDSGPFCSLVFDIASSTLSGNSTWEYWNGAAWHAFTNAELCDNTNASGLGGATNGALTRESGVWSVHWTQMSDWAPVAYNGVTAYWVRMVVGVAGAGTAVQQNRPVYTILWPYVEVEDAAQVLGDIPSIVEAQFQPMSHNCGRNIDSVDVTGLNSNKVMVGLRSLHRGADFTPFINLQQEQNPTGITIAYGANTAETTDATTATGRRATYNAPGPGVDAMADRVRIQFSNALAAQYYGTYRLMLRGRAATNAEMYVEIDQRINTYTTIQTSVRRRFQSLSDWQILDFGQWTIPGFSDVNNDEGVTGMEIVIRTNDEQTVIHGDMYYYELILWPIDEWAAEALDVSSDGQGWAGGDREQKDVWRYLAFDSVKYPRRVLRTITKVSDTDIRGPWRPTFNGPAIAQANQTQRYWFLSWRNPYPGTATENSFLSEAYVASIVSLNNSDRYLSMRGAR